MQTLSGFQIGLCCGTVSTRIKKIITGEEKSSIRIMSYKRSLCGVTNSERGFYKGTSDCKRSMMFCLESSHFQSGPSPQRAGPSLPPFGSFPAAARLTKAILHLADFSQHSVNIYLACIVSQAHSSMLEVLTCVIGGPALLDLTM